MSYAVRGRAKTRRQDDDNGHLAVHHHWHGDDQVAPGEQRQVAA
jgi:hypothetical protein